MYYYDGPYHHTSMDAMGVTCGMPGAIACAQRYILPTWFRPVHIKSEKYEPFDSALL